MNHFVQQTNLHYVLPYFYFHLFAMVIIIRKMCDQWISYGTETCQSGFFVIRLFYIRSVACLRGGRFYLVIVILDSCDAENLYFSRLLINNLLLRFIFFFLIFYFPMLQQWLCINVEIDAVKHLINVDSVFRRYFCGLLNFFIRTSIVSKRRKIMTNEKCKKKKVVTALLYNRCWWWRKKWEQTWCNWNFPTVSTLMMLFLVQHHLRSDFS